MLSLPILLPFFLWILSSGLVTTGMYRILHAIFITLHSCHCVRILAKLRVGYILQISVIIDVCFFRTANPVTVTGIWTVCQKTEAQIWAFMHMHVGILHCTWRYTFYESCCDFIGANFRSKWCSWLRNPALGRMFLCCRTALMASARVSFSQIMRKASTSVADRLIPRAQWTNTLPERDVHWPLKMPLNTDVY